MQPARREQDERQPRAFVSDRQLIAPVAPPAPKDTDCDTLVIGEVSVDENCFAPRPTSFGGGRSIDWLGGETTSASVLRRRSCRVRDRRLGRSPTRHPVAQFVQIEVNREIRGLDLGGHDRNRSHCSFGRRLGVAVQGETPDESTGQDNACRKGEYAPPALEPVTRAAGSSIPHPDDAGTPLARFHASRQVRKLRRRGS